MNNNTTNDMAIENTDLMEELENEEVEDVDNMVEDTTGVTRPEGYTGEIIISPLKAIRAKCIECCCGSKNEVKLCTCCDCPLYPFKLGKSPYRKGRIMSDEQKQAASERFKKLHAEGKIGRKKKNEEE